MAYKVLGSQAATNTTPSQFANNKVIRLAHVGTAARTVTLYESAQTFDLTINATANSTTLLTLTSGNTANVTVGHKIIASSNLAVINTAVASEVASIVNSTAIASNVDIIIANGVCQIYTATAKTFSMIPNSEFVIEKSKLDFLQSNSDTDIVGLAVSYRG